MLTLGFYYRELRGERSQAQVARAAGLDTSLISYIEQEKRVRFDTLKSACEPLNLNPIEWFKVKLLWLQLVSGEPVMTETMAKAAEALALKDKPGRRNEFITELEEELFRNMGLIQREKLEPVILSIFNNPRRIQALRHFHQVSQTLDPRGR